VSVNPNRRGKGYGRKLIEAVCLRARDREHRRIALLVDLDNIDARRLYERLGFQVDRTQSIGGEDFFHMVRQL
jgi:ribosomal protein S18 acetylase RimI-like enzyme